MLFADERTHFFRPLVGKYRGQVVACLRAFYDRLYGGMADYSRRFGRDEVLEIFRGAVTRTPLLDEDSESDTTAPARGEREQANWILNLLLEFGWLERRMDEATLQSSFGFTRHGRLFAQPMVESAGGRFRTRHRNTRNTRNALKSFLDKGEVYDLLDAFEYSERIISDFSDVIAELDDRKRQLVQAVEEQQIVQRASDEFFDFMEKRFMPDLAIRLSADSVEKYRDEISGLIRRARKLPKARKAEAERELRRAAPELVEDAQLSVLLRILDGIEARMHNASGIMLPALRAALNGFTRRADIIIRQLSYSGANHPHRLRSLCQRLRETTEQQSSVAMQAVADATASLHLGLPDPDALRLNAPRESRQVNSRVETHGAGSPETRKRLFIETALDLAFTFNNQAQREYLARALAEGHRIHSQNLPVGNARELLMSAHAIEAGSIGDDGFRFLVRATGNRVTTDYFDALDEFTIELYEPPHADRLPG